MKKFLAVALIVASGLTVHAQDKFDLGPKAGYNSFTLTTNPDSLRASINNSFQVGAFVRIGSKVYLQPEANYEISKSTLNQRIGNIILSQDVSLKSVKIPALLGVKLINKKAFKLRLLAGPAVNFILDKQLNPEQMNDLWPIHSVDDLKNSTWSIQTGAGLDVFFLTLDVRYEMDIDNMYIGNGEINMRNNMFNVSLGIKLL